MSDKKEFDFSMFEEDANRDKDLDLSAFQESPEDSVVDAEPNTLLKDAIEGVKQGATFSFADELGGAVQSGADRTQRLLNRLGLADKSPTQVSEELAMQGFQGELGPTSPSELYEEAKAEELKELEGARERSPGTVMTGELLGAILTPGGVAKAGARGLSKIGLKSGLARGTVAGGSAGALESYGSDQDIGDAALNITLGAGTGGILGRLTDTGKVASRAVRGQDLLEEADELALRSLGASNKDIEDQLRSIYQYNRPKKSGIRAIEEGLVDPTASPKEVLKRVKSMKDNIGLGYKKALGQFDDGSISFDDIDAQQLSANLYDDIANNLPETINDMVTPEMRTNLAQTTSKLQDDIEAALSQKNPIKELQELFVRYNDDYFSNKTTPTANARRLIRDKIKSFQRNLIERANPEAKEQLVELDNQYTNLLDIQDIAMTAASKKQNIGLGDMIRGLTAKMIGIPGAGPIVTGTSIASKKVFNKDITDVLEGASALSKYRRAQKLLSQAEEGRASALSRLSPEEVSISPAVAIGQQMGGDETPKDTQEFVRNNNNYIDNVLELSGQPEEQIFNIINSSPVYKKIYEENPQKISTMAKMLSNAKTPQQKNAMRFKMLQDPEYRNLLQQLNKVGEK